MSTYDVHHDRHGGVCVRERAPNPYEYNGWWYWLDEQRGNHGPYATSQEALLDCMRSVAQVPWYKKLWRAFWYSK